MESQYASHQLASVARRAIAWPIDVCFAFIGALVAMLIAAIFLGSVSWSAEGSAALLVLLAWSVVWELLWVSGPARGKPGQLLLGFRIVDATTGARVRPQRAIVRAVARSVSYVFGPVMLLANVLLIGTMSPRRQTLHDLAAGTIAVRRGALQPSASVPRTVSAPATPVPREAAGEQPSGPFL